MNDELIEQVGRAICTERHGQEWPNIPATEYDCDLAKAAIAAMQPHIEARCEDAARRMQEAAAECCRDNEDYDRDGIIQSDILRIDPAQFREAGNG